MQNGERERAGSREQGLEKNNYESTDWDIELHGGRGGGGLSGRARATRRADARSSRWRVA
jgi:hypothetical protein